MVFPAAFRTINKKNVLAVFTQTEININWTLSMKETPTRTFLLLSPHLHPTNSSANILGGKLSLPIVPKQFSIQGSDLSFTKSNQIAWG